MTNFGCQKKFKTKYSHNRAESRPRNGGGSNHSLPTATDFAGMEVVNNVFDPRTPAALRRRTGVQVGLTQITLSLEEKEIP